VAIGTTTGWWPSWRLVHPVPIHPFLIGFVQILHVLTLRSLIRVGALQSPIVFLDSFKLFSACHLSTPE
jgi:hypothetical protein